MKRWVRVCGPALAVAVLVLAAANPSGKPAKGAAAPSTDGERDRLAMARLQRPPLGLPPVPVSADNPPSAEKIALGRKLFFDRRLSFNGTMSCGMCHIPEQGFTNNELATPIGFAGRSLKRNAPTVLNSAYVRHVFHDGRDTSLETQVINPLLAKNEMANPSIGWLLARIASFPDYEGMFERAFGGGPSIDRVGKAIASWERTLVAGDAPFDRWRFGRDEGALTERQKRGFRLFAGKAGCVKCHAIADDAALFTDDSFHDTGIGYVASDFASEDEDPVPVEVAPGVTIPMEPAVLRTIGDPPEPDLGRYEITLEEADKWRFRTPSLRNVAITGPYMHNGSLRTLEDVVRFYSNGGIPHDGLDPMIRPLGLSDEEVAALVSFLESLTGDGIASLAADARSAAIGD